MSARTMYITDDQSQRDTDAGMLARIFEAPGDYLDDLTALALTR